MGFLFRIFCSLILALGVGYYSARWAIFEISSAQVISNGPWKTNPSVGSAESDPYTRAYIAITAFLALNRSEAIYFFADTDSDGEKLNGNCSYTVKGGAPPARWWTITAYGPDNYLMQNDESRFAVGSGDFSSDGVSFTVSAQSPNNRPWLPIGVVDAFSLTMRIYNPDTALLDNLVTVPLPEIKKEACS